VEPVLPQTASNSSKASQLLGVAVAPTLSSSSKASKLLGINYLFSFIWRHDNKDVSRHVLDGGTRPAAATEEFHVNSPG